MHVRVRHSAPVRVIPVGGRHERVVLAACETEAEIPKVQATDFERLDANFGATEFLYRDGSLWGAVPINRTHYGDQADAAAVFAAWLAGESVEPKLAQILASALHRTPFSVAGPTTLKNPNTPENGRFALPLGTVRDIRRDLRDRAALAVRTQLRQDYALVDGSVLMRLHPLAKVQQLGGTDTLWPVTHPLSKGGHPLQFSLYRIPEAKAFLRLEAGIGGRDVAVLLEALAGRRITHEGDRSWFLNAHAGRVHDAVLSARRRLPDDEGLARFDQTLAPLSDLALCGLADPTEHPMAAALVRDAAEYALPRLSRGYPGEGLLRNLVGLHDRVLTPVPEPDLADAAALGSLVR